MAIDKIIPRFLVADKDERLLEEGAMTDALNVTISVNGDGSEGVIKSIKGSEAVGSANGNLIGTTNEHKCIGSVTDSENGSVYWFVWGDNNDHHVVRYNESTDDYEIILRGSWLNFQEDGFVKGDIINISTPTTPDSTNESPPQRVETFLYFTDNVNEPRKLNVTRALDGDYDNAINSNLDFALTVVKAAPNTPCSFRFVTDSSYGQNKITGNTFQFATQYIYRDGEESAISPYSKLAVSLTDIHTKLPRTDSFVTPLMYNVCEVEIPLTQFIYDLKSVRLLVRQGGETTFFVVDEFNPYEDKQSVGGTVYNSTSRVYNFKNDRLLSAVDPTLVNKLYDNVPLKALGQSISSDRLVYANYEEGRNNHKPLIRGLGFSYHDPDAAISSNIATSIQIPTLISEATPIDIDIDLSSLYQSSTIPAGSQNEISFGFRPEGSVVASTGNFIEVDASDPNGDPVVMSSTFFSLPATSASDVGVSIRFFAARSYSMSNSQDREAIVELIKSKLEDYSVNVVYDYGPANAPTGGYSLSENGNTADVYGDVSVDFKFDDNIEINTSGVLTLHPRIVGVDFSNAGLTDNYTFGPTFGGVFANTSDNVPSVIANNEANQQWSSFISGYISSQNITSVSETYVSSFKAGSNHKFGIVYYDKYNRSGFVNELGTVYNKWYGERAATGELMGPSSLNLSFEGLPAPLEIAPVWADRYQLVCTGPVEIDNYVQYTTGGGYPARYVAAPAGVDGSSDGHPDKNKCQIYVNIDTLELYKGEKNSLRDYSFTKGDKLRIVSRDIIRQYTAGQAADTFSATTEYPLANDGSIMEFDVVGVEILNASNEDIIHAGATDSQHHGTFLVLEQPAIASGATFVDSNNVTQTLKYDGFDFFSISQYTYRGDGSASNSSSGFNYWGHNCVVEIYTPAKSTDEHVYYEIGESVKIDTSPPDGLTTNAGSVHYRPVACKSPVPLQDTTLTSGQNASIGDFNIGAAEAARTSVWQYFVRRLESSTASDYFPSKAWNAGRAHVVYDKAAQRRIRNGITYSDAYVEDSEVLALSSFNPSLANFTSLNHRFGPINYIANYNDDLVAIQQNKFSLIPINKNIIQYSGGSSNVTISTDIFSKPQYSTGDFGCDHPESALVVDNDVYFVDASRRKVMRFAGGQLTPISDKDMQSVFDDFFYSDRDRFVSGYDPSDGAYYITGTSSNTPTKNTTYSYNVDYGRWQSRCSFVPDFYGFVNNLMVSFIQDGGHIHTHDRDQDLFMGSFYGTNYPCYVDVVSKISPSRVKVFNAVSYEGSDNNWRLPHGSISTSTGQVVQGNGEIWFTEKEGAYYSALPRAVKLNSLDNSNVLFLGVLTHVSGGEYTSSVRVDSLPIPIGGTPTYNVLGNTGATLAATRVTSVNRNTIVFENTTGIFDNGLPVYIELDEILSGDSVRGHFMKFRLQNETRNKTELYCINTHITDSKYHHALGEQ